MRAPMFFSVALTLLTSSILFSTANNLTTHAGPPQADIGKWFFSEFQPEIKPGGRANTVAVHPTNDKTILVASESGGLFKSIDGGETWHHVDTLPVFYTNAVTFVPKNPKTVILTASEDFGVTGSDRGGIWRSEDEGDTWTQVAKTSLPVPTGADRLTAFEISIAPDTGKIYVGSNRGVLISKDAEGTSWNQPIDPFLDIASAHKPAVLSVVALPVTTDQGCGANPGGGNLVLVGGPSGIRRSLDGGVHWCKPKQDLGCPVDPAERNVAGCVMDIHAFGRSSNNKKGAYVVVPEGPDADQKWFMNLYQTGDGGDTWSFVRKSFESYCSNGPCCGGIAGIKAVITGTGTELYFSNRCSIEKRDGGDWVPYIKWPETTDAGDTRDLAFHNQNQKPYLAATDGGVIKAPTDNDPMWRFAGAKGNGNVPNGFSALQIYEVKGQWIANSRHDLYFGTQDNRFWTSGDTGQTWTDSGVEGFFIEGQYHVAKATDSQITFKDSQNKWSGPLFKNPTPTTWSNPQFSVQNSVSSPKIVAKDFHIQGYQPMSPLRVEAMQKGLAQTIDLGQKWKQYAVIMEDRVDLPKLCCASPSKRLVLYQAIRLGLDSSSVPIDRLVRITKGKNATIASVDYVTMSGFKGLGVAPVMGTPFSVFAVDPGNQNHLIAADLRDGAMKESSNGGDDWTTMTDLTSLVTDGGKLNFSGLFFINGQRTGPASLASAVSFCPDDPRMVAVGTAQSGVFVSDNRGKTWTKIPGSERATLISSLHWRKCDDIIVSTYGRGLWRARINQLILESPCRSPNCFHVFVKRPPQEEPRRFELAILVFNGRIEGARVTDGMLDELFIEPSASVVFAGRFLSLPEIKITETTNPMGFQGIRDMPSAPREAQIITGITLRQSGTRYELVGLMFSPNRVPAFVSREEEPAEQEVARQPRPSPNAGKPYLELVTGPTTAPGRMVQLAGRGLRAGTSIEIAINGHTVQTVRVQREGTFLASMQAPMQFGTHSITLKGADGRIIDGTMISVIPADPPR